MSGAIDAQSLGDLMDGDDGGFAAVIAQLERDLEQKDELARRLRDQCRYQHLVLSEIHDLAGRHLVLAEIHDLAGRYAFQSEIHDIRTKAHAAIAAANKSGLLA